VEIYKMDFDTHSLKIEDKFLEANPGVLRRSLAWRMDGRLEWTCKHGVGHTIFAPHGLDYVHGCNGNCKKIKIPEWSETDLEYERELTPWELRAIS